MQLNKREKWYHHWKKQNACRGIGLHHFTLGSIPPSHGSGTGGVLSTAEKLKESFARAFLRRDKSHGPWGKYFPHWSKQGKVSIPSNKPSAPGKMITPMRDVGWIHSPHTKIMARQGLNPWGFSRGMGDPLLMLPLFLWPSRRLALIVGSTQPPAPNEIVRSLLEIINVYQRGI